MSAELPANFESMITEAGEAMETVARDTLKHLGVTIPENAPKDWGTRKITSIYRNILYFQQLREAQMSLMKWHRFWEVPSAE